MGREEDVSSEIVDVSPLSVDEKRALAREMLLLRQQISRPPSDRGRSEIMPIGEHCRYLYGLIDRGGPTRDEWESADAWIESLIRGYDDQLYTREQLQMVQDVAGARLTTTSVAGFILHKPHGYPGDFELIDRIYTRLRLAPEAERWDTFIYEHPGAQALRNRKDYFKQVLTRALSNRTRLDLLNVACGPCRDVLEWFEEHSTDEVSIHCLDQDPVAIEYARGVLGGHAERVKFVTENIRSWRPEQTFDLIWSAGLLDYFDDRLFVETIERFMTWVRPGGTIVVGNYSPRNPSRSLMTVLDWILTYRSEAHLIELARRCGVPRERIVVGREPLGINLFLHLQL